MLLDLKYKNFLVIDDFAEFRKLLKRMLESLGLTKIDEASSGEAAIRKMENKEYDIILCDYNLGYGKKDGQQVLEEAKYRKLIKYSCIFMMITAENTMPMVMGAVEYQPDDYMIKPLSKDILTRRLDKSMKRKSDFEEIEAAIRNNEYMRAISLCSELAKSNPRNIMEYLRLQSELCITIGRYQEATAVFEQVLAMREIPWAKMGLGKVNFISGDYVKAKSIFQAVIDENTTYMEAYDWLAKTMEEMGSLEEAQKVLVSATVISPKAILRHQAIGKMSYKRCDYDTANEAFRSAIAIGRNSCFKSPSDYTSLAKTLVQKDSSEEALSVLGDARNEFRGDSEAILQAAVTEGIVYKKLNREDEAKKSIQEAARLFDSHLGNIPLEATMDMAKVCFELGEKETGIKFMQNIMKNNHDNDQVIKMCRDVFKEAKLSAEGEQMIISARGQILKLNNDGVALTEAGKFEEAIKFFEKAVNGFPENKVINANAAQTLMMYMKKNGKNEKSLLKVSQYLDRIQKIDPSYDRYRELLSMYENIKNSAPNPKK